MRKVETKKMVGLALLTSIVVVLQILGGFIRFGMFSISLVLVPIVVGAALYGWKSGAWLGLIFAVMVFLTGDAGAFLAVNPLGTIIVVVVKGVLAGLCAGLVYKAFEKKNTYLATVMAAIVCPIVNTGVFLLGCKLFFMGIVMEWATAAGFTGNVAGYMFLVLAGGNFLFELGVNVVLSPVIVRLINIGKGRSAAPKKAAKKAEDTSAQPGTDK